MKSTVPRATPRQSWWQQRLPLQWVQALRDHPVPVNLNFWSVFGSLALVLLVLQLGTGLLLTMRYKPDAGLAFASVEAIVRDLHWGWLLRDLHAAGASAFFVVIYLHMFRGLLYGSYRQPRELVWLIGCGLMLTLMAEAFCGYLLPWGQMSYWGAQVIVNLVDAIPAVGPALALWLRGDYLISDATLNRFFALHVAGLPLLLLLLAGLHVVALHRVGSGNPEGVDREDLPPPSDAPAAVPFHPRYTAHDLCALSLLLLLLAAVVLLDPTLGGFVLEPENFVQADPLKTPEHIAPVWYFTPFYAVLRSTTEQALRVWLALLVLVALVWLWHWRQRPRAAAVLAVGALLLGWGLLVLDAKLWGVLLLVAALLSLCALPWLDRSPQRSMRRRPRWHRLLLALFAAAFIVLGVCGALPASQRGSRVALLASLVYFAYVWTMPWWSRLGRAPRERGRCP